MPAAKRILPFLPLSTIVGFSSAAWEENAQRSRACKRSEPSQLLPALLGQDDKRRAEALSEQLWRGWPVAQAEGDRHFGSTLGATQRPSADLPLASG